MIDSFKGREGKEYINYKKLRSLLYLSTNYFGLDHPISREINYYYKEEKFRLYALEAKQEENLTTNTEKTENNGSGLKPLIKIIKHFRK